MARVKRVMRHALSLLLARWDHEDRITGLIFLVSREIGEGNCTGFIDEESGHVL